MQAAVPNNGKAEMSKHAAMSKDPDKLRLQAERDNALGNTFLWAGCGCPAAIAVILVVAFLIYVLYS